MLSPTFHWPWLAACWILSLSCLSCVFGLKVSLCRLAHVVLTFHHSLPFVILYCVLSRPLCSSLDSVGAWVGVSRSIVVEIARVDLRHWGCEAEWGEVLGIVADSLRGFRSMTLSRLVRLTIYSSPWSLHSKSRCDNDCRRELQWRRCDWSKRVSDWHLVVSYRKDFSTMSPSSSSRDGGGIVEFSVWRVTMVVGHGLTSASRIDVIAALTGD